MQDTPAPTPTPATPTPTPAFIAETVFHALMSEVNERLRNAEATNALIVAEIDNLIAEVAELKAAA